jgi:protein TonB
VNRLLLPIFLSLGIHALLMGLDWSWFKIQPQPTPYPDLVTISLVSQQPKGSKQAATSKKPASVSEKKQMPAKKEAFPSKTAIKHRPETLSKPKQTAKQIIPPAKTVPQTMPIKPETAMPEEAPKEIPPPKPKPTVQPIKPPVKTPPQQTRAKKETSIKKKVPEKIIPLKPKPPAPPVKPEVKTVPLRTTAKKEVPIKKEVPAKKIKPKKSLKKITKKQKKATPQKEVARAKSIEPAQPKPAADKPSKKKAPIPEKSPPRLSESSSRIQPQDAAANQSASKKAPGKEPSNLAIKGDTSAAVGLVLARPLYRKNPPPAYPRRARRKGYQGVVILEVLVNEKGKVDELKVFKSSGYKILDKSAISAVQKWLFEAGTKNGRSAQMWVRVPIRFRLD